MEIFLIFAAFRCFAIVTDKDAVWCAAPSFSVLLLLIVAAEIFTEPLARAIAPGFSPEQFRELIFLLRIILPAQFFFYCGGLAMAVQQTHGVFLYAALAPLAYNSGIILCGVAFNSQK